MSQDAPYAGAAPRTHRVSIGEFHLGGHGERLAIYGLGSCVALLLHDRSRGISALGHFLLPAPAAGGEPPGSPGRFATTAIPAMIGVLRERGAVPGRLIAKVAGAAEMFRYERRAPVDGIGARNLRATLEMLARLRIPIQGQDTGGSYGRTVIVDAGTGRMEVRAVRVEERIL